ncbi:SET domain-containing protein [Armillaria solidipes]|uniref:SET domain-containing protein n=1 Tax=Armillaria solidipes TaxID=1076256 RepID=A0A2H3BL72_9AGAR|nr:SET domain-containing protein [Armillaria solidipes]
MKRGFLTTAKAKRQFSALNPENTDKPTIEKWTSLQAGSVDDLKVLKIIEGSHEKFLDCTVEGKGITKEQLKKKAAQAMDTVGYTDEDFEKASASAPDDDPGAFVNTPHEHDDPNLRVSVTYKGDGNKVFRISSSPGKGLDMFATRKIKMGDLIVDERPLMVVSLSPNGVPVTRMKEGLTPEGKYQYLLYQSEGVVHSVFVRMSEESKKAFKGLYNGHLHGGTEETKKLLESTPDDLKCKVGRYTSVFKDLSRVNHLCSPNTHRKFYRSSFMQLRAARDIEEGEEIFTNYTATEHAEDLGIYGIKCTCRACLDPVESDPIRAAVLNRPCVTAPMMREAGARPDAWIDPVLYNAYVHQNDEKKALMYGEKLWMANLAAGEKRFNAFRKVELMKKSPQWMMAKMMGGLPVVPSIS